MGRWPTPFQRRVATDVVAVAMRDHQRGRRQALAVDMFQNRLGLKNPGSKIDVFPPFEMGDIGIFAEWRRNNRGHSQSWGF